MKTLLELKKDKEKAKPEFHFRSGSGRQIKLMFVKNEYRAYYKSGLDWVDMKLGSCVPEPLRDYIIKNK